MWWLLYDGLMPYCSLVDILGEATMALGECQGMRIGAIGKAGGASVTGRVGGVGDAGRAEARPYR